jgi:methylmalonyl-CoA mutase, N-terminal domain
MTINATAAVLLAMYVAVARRQGVSPDRLSGTVQNDILKEYVARGLYVYPPGPSLRLAVDVIAFCQSELPRFNSISISGYHIREAGSTAVQEVAFTLANAIAYVEAVLARGLDVDQFAPRLSFFFNAHSDFLEEVAKFRAARRLWARTMRERFGAKDPRSWTLRFHAQTAGSSLVAQQPQNNVVRTTLQALAAVLGGCQSLHTNALDEALALPSEDTARLALRTQQVIAFESGVTATADPLGGSYYVESLTDRIEEQAVEYLRRIEEQGGALKCVEAGFIQREIQDSAYLYQRQVETGERVVVGVNRFGESRELPISLLQVDPTVADSRTQQLADLRERRDSDRVRSALEGLRRGAMGTENLMVPILACVESLATIGEIADVLRGVFGEYSSGS